MAGIWIRLGGATAAVTAAALAAGCSSGDKPAPRAEDVATSTTPVRADAAPTAPAIDAAPLGEPLEAFAGFRFVAEGATAEEVEATRLLAKVERLAAEECDDADAARIEIARADLDPGRPGVETIVASLTHGVFALAGDDVIARSTEALGACEGSQTELVGLWVGQVVADAEPELVVIDQFGGRNMGQTTLTIAKRRGDRVATIFSAVLAEYEGDDETTRKVELGADGTIRAETTDGPVSYTWDAAAFKFAAPGPAK